VTCGGLQQDGVCLRGLLDFCPRQGNFPIISCHDRGGEKKTKNPPTLAQSLTHLVAWLSGIKVTRDMQLVSTIDFASTSLKRVRSTQHTRVTLRAGRRVSCRASTDFFKGVPQAPPDPILGISDAFKKSTSPDKLNLGVGAYRTEELKPLVLTVVQKVERQIVDRGENREYQPIQGLESFNKCTAELLFGKDSKILGEDRVATLQSLSGTGSLRVGAAFIGRFMPGTKVYLSNPTWGNHKSIFPDAGVEFEMYRYFKPETRGLDFEGMVADIEAAPAGSVILLHGCAHNPTGVDPTKEQWEKIADICEAKGHLPFFDVAYQGFATGDLLQDSFAPRYFADRGFEMFVAQSYSKNLGLYSDRVGAINLVCKDADSKGRSMSQLKKIARALYSNPPVHGARIVAEILGDEKLFDEWYEELKGMAGRIKKVRGELVSELQALGTPGDWSFINDQIGMFSYTGLTEAQVENMTNKHAIFMTFDGRISLAGLSSDKVKYLANAIDDSVRNVQ